MRRTTLIFFILLPALTVQAQADKHKLRDGNHHYNKECYDQAEVSYRRALETDSTDYKGQFNLASSLYRQGKYDDAAHHYDKALQHPTASNAQRAHAFHNKGNCHLKAGMESKEQGMQHLQQAVSSYQEALKLDPKNDDTRYNLAYARRLLQQHQQQQNQQQNGDNKDQDKKDQQQQQNNQQQQQQNNQQQQQQNNQQQQQQQQTGQDNKQNKQQQNKNQQTNQRKQDAERMLEAVKNNERQTLKEQQKKIQAVTGKHSDKDW